MKLATIILATALALSGTSSHAQTEAPGSSAARQWVGDPLTQKPTYEEMRRGVTTGSAIRNQRCEGKSRRNLLCSLGINPFGFEDFNR